MNNQKIAWFAFSAVVLLLFALFVFATPFTSYYDFGTTAKFGDTSTRELNFNDSENRWFYAYDEESSELMIKIEHNAESGSTLSYKIHVRQAVGDNYAFSEVTCRDNQSPQQYRIPTEKGLVKIWFSCLDDAGSENRFDDFSVQVDEQYVRFVREELRGETPTPTAQSPANTGTAAPSVGTGSLTINRAAFEINNPQDIAISFNATAQLQNGFKVHVSKNTIGSWTNLTDALAGFNSSELSNTSIATELFNEPTLVSNGAAVTQNLTGSSLSQKIGSYPDGKYLVIVSSGEMPLMGAFLNVTRGAAQEVKDTWVIVE